MISKDMTKTFSQKCQDCYLLRNRMQSEDHISPDNLYNKDIHTLVDNINLTIGY